MTSTISYIHGAQGYIAGPGTVWPSSSLHRWELMEAGKYVEAEQFGARMVPFMHRYLTGDEFGGDFVFHDGATFKVLEILLAAWRPGAAPVPRAEQAGKRRPVCHAGHD